LVQGTGTTDLLVDGGAGLEINTAGNLEVRAGAGDGSLICGSSVLIQPSVAAAHPSYHPFLVMPAFLP
jgi:hypothetical protein